MRVIRSAMAAVLSLAMLVTGVYVGKVETNAGVGEYYKVEAENMQVNRARIMDAKDNQDSNGKHVEVFWQEESFASNDVSNNSYVRMVVNASSAGEYTFKLGCTTWGDVTARAYANNSKTDLTIPSGTAQEYEFTLNLNKGQNSVILSWINWCEIDYMLVPDSLSVVDESTDVYYPAATAKLNMTWFNTYSSIYDPTAEMYTGTLYFDVDEDGAPGTEEWQPSATFTVDTPNNMQAMNIEYYIDEAGKPNSQLSLFINGSLNPLTINLDNTGVAKISASDLVDKGLVLGAKNTIKIKQIAITSGSVGIYSLTEITGSEPVSEDLTKTAKALVNDGNIRMMGRTLTESTAQTMDWTCSGFQFDYNGGGTITANITTDSASKLIIDINGTVTEKVARKGTSNVILASGLDAGDYKIKVYKTTEANGYLTQLNSISYDKNGSLTATAAADLKFEFIGDSITCGNQINSETGAEDGYKAYASVLARAFGADWNTIACTGRGLMEGCNSEEQWTQSQNAQMKDVFDYVSYFRDKNTVYNYNDEPDVLVINLGNEDLGESIMETFGTTMTQFCNEVKAFSTKIRSKYPNTKIVWCYGAYVNNADADKYADAVESLNDSNMIFVELPQMIGGQGGNPNYTQQIRIAKILASKVAQMLGINNPMAQDSHYEAESGTITANETGATIKTETGRTPYSANGYAADMNVSVGTPKDAAYVTVPVSVDKAGLYNLTISYGSSADENPVIAVKSNNYDWSISTVETAASWDMIKTFDVQVYLKAGDNKVSITGAINDNSWANIDCFEVEYLKDAVEPGVSEEPTTQAVTTQPTTKVQQVTTNATVKAPGRVKIKKVTNVKGKKAKVSLKKVNGAAGYQIQYSLKKNIKKAKSTFTKKLVFSTKKLKNKKTYYFRARAYKMEGKTKKYGEWSKVKSVKIKK